MDRLGQWLFSHQRTLAGATLALALLSAIGLLRLSTDLDPAGLVPVELPRTLVAVVEVEEFTPDGLRDVAHVSEVWARDASVERVESLTHSALPHIADLDDESDTLEAMIALIEASPAHFEGGLSGVAERTGGPLVVSPMGVRAGRIADELRGTLVGRSGRSALVIAELAPDADPQALTSLVSDLEAVTVTGLPLLEDDLERELTRDPILLIILAALGNVLVLFLGFRRQAGVALPLAAAGLTIAFVIGAMGWLGIPLTLLDVIIPPLLLTLGVSDAVHLIGRDAEERHRGTPEDAARASFRVMARACLATSVTTAIGFGSLLVADSPAVRRLAMLSILGVVVAYAVTVLVVPTLLPRFRGTPHQPGPWTSWIAEIGVRHRRGILLLAGVVAVLSTAAASTIDVGTRLLEPFDEAHPRVATSHFVAREHMGIRQLEVTTQSEEAASSLTAWLREQPEVLGVRGAVPLLDAVWRKVASGPRPEGVLPELRGLAEAAGANVGPGQTLLVGLGDLPDRDIVALAERIRAQDAEVGGEAWVTSTELQSLTWQLVGGFGIALLVIVGVLGVLLRSMRLGLLSLPPNLLPLMVVAGWMGLRDIPLTASTAMVFAITLGLVVDGTIHLMMRYREERQHKARQESVRATMRHSGRAVLLGGATLLAGFAPILASRFEPLALFAELSVVAIVAAILAELFLTPALLARPGRNSRLPRL
ncbi:MAG: MMPL family transporter [Myxococcota bacterium]